MRLQQLFSPWNDCMVARSAVLIKYSIHYLYSGQISGYFCCQSWWFNELGIEPVYLSCPQHKLKSRELLKVYFKKTLRCIAYGGERSDSLGPVSREMQVCFICESTTLFISSAAVPLPLPSDLTLIFSCFPCHIYKLFCQSLSRAPLHFKINELTYQIDRAVRYCNN